MDLIFEGADISNAYLYGDLDAPVKMELPKDSSREPEKEDHVNKVIRSLYGYRSEGKIWGNVIQNIFTSWWLREFPKGKRLYFRNQEHKLVVLAIVVDDIAKALNCRSLIESLKSHLEAEFKVELLGPFRSFIG